TRGTSATYVGAFTLGSPPYRIERIPDSESQERDGIIFSLVPLNADSSRLPSYGGVSPAQSPVMSEWSPPEATDVIVAADEQPSDERVVSRVEHELQARFGQWLTTEGEPPQALRLPVGSVTIEPDMYVPSRHWIVEAKKSTARSYVRMAIGQVLDYVHTAKRLGLEATPAMLLPGIPDEDLLELASGLGIVVISHTPEWVEVFQPDNIHPGGAIPSPSPVI